MCRSGLSKLIMEILMPKQLQISLDSLFNENDMQGWSIHGTFNTTTVVLRFKMADNDPNQAKTSIKYKRASSSQISRDCQRAKDRNTVLRSDIGDSLDSGTKSNILTDHQKDTASNEKQYENKLDHVQPPQTSPCVSPRITRSKVKSKAPLKADDKPLRANIKAKPSPVPQLDGSAEQSSPRKFILDCTEPWQEELVKMTQDFRIRYEKFSSDLDSKFAHT